ncbi:DUF4870 family protein [Thiomicrorhabdus arctica]|uniref:DUF4870 family protein n=1 Tax=Thiomicrorhabdus arctica TaxID=131540 RepID=UPI00037616F0|nr:DUF4870 domain-containing protein [Thiomicrorhabdus arctica]
MSDPIESTHPLQPSQAEPVKPSAPKVSTTAATIIYVLYLLNFIIPFGALIGLIMAYINKNEEDNFLQSHYQFQIRTFWIGLLYMFIGGLLTIILIGWLMILFYIIWLIIRCVKGLKYLNKKQPVPNPTSWMFG